MRTSVYIDGFNFYYQVYESNRAPSTCKWLNFLELARRLAPSDNVTWVGFFSAKVITDNQPNSPETKQFNRQMTLWSALRSTGKIEIIEGNFKTRVKKGLPWDAQNECALGGVVEVQVREEKGTDVNLASRLMFDASKKRFEKAVVISNDRDLRMPLGMVHRDLQKEVHLISPADYVNPALAHSVTHSSCLDLTLLPQCQFPTRVTFDNRVIACPPEWM